MKRTLSLIFIIFWCQELIAELLIGPYLQNVTTNSITVIWETDNQVKGLVKYGLSKDHLIHIVNEDDEKKLHKITLTGLSPRRTYFYQCKWDDQNTAIGRFTTAPLSYTLPIRLMIYGDSRNNPTMHHEILESASRFEPGLILNTGDLVDDGRVYTAWKEQLFEPAKDYLINTPYYPVPGNHEEEADYYYNYFTIHQDKKWWSTDYGDVHLIGLNSNIAGDPDSEQYQWLVKDLEANQNKPWIIVLFHHPLFHVNPHRPVYNIRYYWHPIFMKYGVDLVFTGHDHYYLRTYPIGRMSNMDQSVVYFITAGGGAPLYSTTARPYAAYSQSSYHFIILDITEQQIFVKAIKPDGECFDTFVLNQKKRFSSSQFIEFGMFELEYQLINLLGNLSAKEIAPNLIQYDTTLVLKANFDLPITYQINWEADDQWQIASYRQKTKSDSLTISFRAVAPKDKLLPTPKLKLHLQVENSEIQAIPGFINQDIEISLEEAAYKRAMLATTENMEPLFNFIRYYTSSKYVTRVARQLCWLTYQKPDRNILKRIDEIVEINSSYINQFRYYPLYFIFNDFSHWDEWLIAIDNLPVEEEENAPKFIFFIAFMDNLNMRFIREWSILGPFANHYMNKSYPPEQELDLNKKYTGLNNREIFWRKVKTNNKNYLDLKQEFEPFSSGIGYARTNITAKKAGKILLLLGYSSEIVVWVNKEEVLRKKINRSPQPCQEVLQIDVQEGENNILIKSASGNEDWGIYLQIIDKDNLIENMQ